jgi:hypothetical protein
MDETVPLKNEKSLLPFATPTQKSEEPLTKDAERATVYCLAELDRNKGGGFFKKHAPEKLVFIAEVYYPFWVAPFGSLTLLLDGLNLASHAIPYTVLPDFKAFTNEMQVRSETRQAYTTFLSNNINYFQVPNNEETKVIDGLIMDTEFFEEFMPYLSEAVTTKAPVVDSVLVAPAKDEDAVLLMTKELGDLQSKFIGDVTELNGMIKLLNLRTKDFLDVLRGEKKETEKKFSKPIKEAKTALEKVTTKINKEHTEKITEMSNQFEQEILAEQKEIITLEKTKEQVTAEIEHCEAEIRTAEINKDDVTAQKWKEKRTELKKELPENSKKTKELTEKIKEIEEKRRQAIFQLEAENDAKIKEASKDLIAVESARDAEISILQKEMEKLEELTATIIKNIDQLAKMREATIAEFDSFGVQQKQERAALFHMPFYLVLYQSKQDTRYTFFAPSFVSSLGVGTKLKAMGKAKISQLFQPRSKKIISVLNKFAILLGDDVAFSREISEACRKANLLEVETLKQSIAAGLDKLKTAEWLSEQEAKSFNQRIK